MTESPHLEKLFQNNKKWVNFKVKEDADFFKNMAHGQQPRYLWIGCSDSRVPAEFITGCDPGEMFIHRNIANLVVNSDINLLSVLQFAVENIKVKDIIVCGHYGCGGVAAAASNIDHGLLDHWLRNIRDVNRIYNEELESIPDIVERNMRLVELNVIEQCVNLYKNGIIQRNQQKFGYPRIHGLVYDIASGHLKQLDINFKTYMDSYKNIYRLYPFQNSIVQARAIADICEEHVGNDGKISIQLLKEKLRDSQDVTFCHFMEETLEKLDDQKEGKVSLNQFVTLVSERVNLGVADPSQ